MSLAQQLHSERVSLFDLVWKNNSRIHPEWRELFSSYRAQPTLEALLRESLEKISRKGDIARICPSMENIFAPMYHPLRAVRVCIIGMDPYPNLSHTTGFSFSVPDGVKPPPSLANIFGALINQGLMNAEHMSHGNLSRWVEQGVLLINAAFTTIVGKSGAHKSEWEQFSRALIGAICRAQPGTIFMLFGRDAQKFRDVITSGGCSALMWGHPSPMNPENSDRTNSRHFIWCSSFKLANNALIARGQHPINWDPCAPVLSQASLEQSAQDARDARAMQLERGTPNAGIEQSALISEQKLETEVLDPCDQLNPPGTSNVIYAFVDGACRASISRAAGSRALARKPVAGYGVAIITHFDVLCGSASVMRISGLVVHNEETPTMRATNNRAELCALMELFSYATTAQFIERYGNNTPLVIIYDSCYAANCVREWYERWLRNPPEEIKLNRDIISIAYEKMKQVMQARNLEWIHVNSHVREPHMDFTNLSSMQEWFYWRGNEEADHIASMVVEQHLGRETD